MEWSCYVIGRPAPQGSKRLVGGRRMVESSKHVGAWRDAVVAQVFGRPRLDGPLVAGMVFGLSRPRSARRADILPSRYPDLSKLARATEDAITDAGGWADDSRVVAYSTLAKTYAGWPLPGGLVLPVPGALIAVVALDGIELAVGISRCDKLLQEVAERMASDGRRWSA